MVRISTDRDGREGHFIFMKVSLTGEGIMYRARNGI